MQVQLQTFVNENGVHHMRTGMETALEDMVSPDDSILSVSSFRARPGDS